MRSFGGFPPGKTRFTPIPDLFYTELLPAIDDLAELKVTLYMFYSLNRQRGYPRYQTGQELAGEGVLLTALASLCQPSQDPVDLLEQALEQAVERGSLLRLSICDEDDETHYYFVNSAQGRQAVDQVKSGELELETTGFVREPHIVAERHNIFELYERNIGLLQPLLSEELKEAAASYPQDWIEDAFQIAVEANARSWRYIRTVLERWKAQGRQNDNRRRNYSRRA